MTSPAEQRDIQRLKAKRSMGGGKGTLRSAIGRVRGAHAGYRQGRRLEFGRLAQHKKQSDISYKLNKARLQHSSRMLGLREDALSEQRSQLPYHLGGKLLSTIGYGYEGYRRKKELEASTKLKERRHQEILTAMQGSRGGGTGEGSLMGLRARRVF